MIRVRSNSIAREKALQYLYQCERQKLFYFNEGHFDRFVTHFKVSKEAVKYLRVIVEKTLDEWSFIDQTIAAAMKNWSLMRLSSTDRAILRLAVAEILLERAPAKVIINEAIELSKQYGLKDSPRFVNGVLDKIYREKSTLAKPLFCSGVSIAAESLSNGTD